jgi:tetratricopeptide (TPR) repeat protein
MLSAVVRGVTSLFDLPIDSIPHSAPSFGCSAVECEVAAIKSHDSIYELYDWVEHLRMTLPIDAAIRTVSDSLEKVDGEDHYVLALQLAQLLREAERYTEAVQVLDRMMQRYPDDVRSAMSRATDYLYFLEEPEEALKWINLALQRAYRTGFFRREALGNKARILLQLGRGDELSDVLEEIMSLQIVKGIPDIGRERDFVDRALPGLIRKGVLDRYNEFRPKRPGDTPANELPKYEPPDDAA